MTRARRRAIAEGLAAREAFRQPLRCPIGPAMRFVRLAAASLAFAVFAEGCQRQEAATENAAEEAGPAKGLLRDKAGQLAPDIELRNADDDPGTLAEAQGKPLLVNIWATWCAPCVKELPTLQAVAVRAGAPRVIAVSQDMAPRGSVDAFLDKNELADLEVWHDPKMALSSATGTEVLPTTILYDAKGRELWRYVGDLDWTGEEAARLLADAGKPATR
jgi:thiol-disulfide isomerase/thioredoxin